MWPCSSGPPTSRGRRWDFSEPSWGSDNPPDALHEPQVQPDRTLLAGAGEEVERGLADQPGSGPAMRPPDDLEGIASDGETLSGDVSRRGPRGGQGDEAVRGTTAALGDPADV